MSTLLYPPSLATRRPQVRRRSLATSPLTGPPVDSPLTGSPSAWRDFCAVASDDPEDDNPTVDVSVAVGLGPNAVAEFILPAALLASVEALATPMLSVDEIVALALAAYVATARKAVA